MLLTFAFSLLWLLLAPWARLLGAGGMRTGLGRDFPLALAIGYGAVIWGPVEDEAWGKERAGGHAQPGQAIVTC